MTFEKLYYDPSHNAGYSAVDNLTRADNPNFSRGEVVRWLESQEAYTLHRLLRRKFPRLHYNVTNIDDVWEADLIELRNLKSYNDGYSYLLVIIDVLSKYVWVEPLRDKTSNCAIKAFQRVLAKSEGRVPVYPQTDKGKEFVAQSMQKFLKENNIRFRVTRNPDIKAAIVERFNRTLKERMWVMVGEACQDLLDRLNQERQGEIVKSVYENCLAFYDITAKEIRNKLFVKNEFLCKLRIFEPKFALQQEDEKNTSNNSVQVVLFVAQRFGGFDEEILKEEWQFLKKISHQSRKPQ
ncbi:PREDICTED: uncharacterized protein LOC108765815 [Trachymyrmex cornetzi]|uniref:uncharacterized protein LOC108765815 n=1 Tax=Trachymyrmex cornetzi TaxID=471704 RepID=UPI00084F7805|nr:PREDICTED: uncharacterized protein LOC108765815 [Trachymyrmex cornetzi]